MNDRRGGVRAQVPRGYVGRTRRQAELGRLGAARFALALLAGIGGASAGPAAAGEIRASGFTRNYPVCLDIKGGGRFRDRQALQTYECNGTEAQRFSAQGNYVTAQSFEYDWRQPGLVGPSNLMCVDRPYTHDTSPVWVYRCWGGSNQRWEIVDALVGVGRGWVLPPPAGHGQRVRVGDAGSRAWASITYTRAGELRLPDGRCIDVPWNTADGTRVVAYQCHGGQNQKWSLERRGIVGLGGKCLASSHHPVFGGSGELFIETCREGYSRQQFWASGRLRGDANRCLTSTGNYPYDNWRTGNGQPVYLRGCGAPVGIEQQTWTMNLFG